MPTAKEIYFFFFGGGDYVAIWRRYRGKKPSSKRPEVSEVFSAQISSLGQGNNQPMQPLVIFQEIFLSFYEDLQVPTKFKINMPYKNVNQDNTEQKEIVHKKDT